MALNWGWARGGVEAEWVGRGVVVRLRGNEIGFSSNPGAFITIRTRASGRRMMGKGPTKDKPRLEEECF